MFFIHRALDEKQSENDTLTPIIQMHLHRYYPHHPKTPPQILCSMYYLFHKHLRLCMNNTKLKNNSVYK